ncbi:MAG: hypothetical protein LBL66_04405 [Clostridiales bacterium]|jgi:hypothetical protein|nr:hypothetical protein [Clostridiales bacterium]
MKHKFKIITLIALALAALLSLAACSGLEPIDADDTGDAGDAGKQIKTASYYPGNFDYYDYYEDVYGLGLNSAYQFKTTDDATETAPYYYATKSHVTVNGRSYNRRLYNPFQTLAYEPFTFLLESSLERDLGYYAIVFGGEWESGTQSVLNTVNQAAAAFAADNTKSASGSTAGQRRAGQGSTIFRAIYNFDFKVNGGLEIENRLKENGVENNPLGEYDSDIRTDVSQNGAYGGSANNDYSARTSLTKLYVDLINGTSTRPGFDVTTNATALAASGLTSGQTVSIKTGKDLSGTGATANLIKSPSVLLFKKWIDGGTLKNTVVDFTDATATDFSAAKVTALLNKIPLTGAAATGAGLPSTATGLKKFDYFKYIFGTYTQGSSTALAYARPDAVPAASFTNSTTGEKLNVQYDNLTDDNHIYKFVSYAELIHLLQSDGNFAFYFGGSWCHYSRGFLAPFNQLAKIDQYTINEVYFFDPYIDGASSATNIRSSETAVNKDDDTLGTTTFLSRLYANLLTYFDINWQSGGFPSTNDYLSNKFIEQGLVAESYNEDLSIGGKRLTKIGVPTLIAYNKDNVDQNGDWKPIIGKASSGDTFEGIVGAAEEPHKGGVYVGTLAADGKLYFSTNADYSLDDCVTDEVIDYLTDDFATAYAALNANQKANLTGTKFWKGVNYLGIVRTSTAGRSAENNILQLLYNFYEGHLTYKVVGE